MASRRSPDSLEYRQMLVTACRLAGEFVPEEERVLIVSKGDDDLLAIAGRHAAHFPQVAGGTYAGHHPADSAEAIHHLEELRHQGWHYLLFPATSLWWLSHYAHLNAHLQANYQLICNHSSCTIYRLTSPIDSRSNGPLPGNLGGRRPLVSPVLANGSARQSEKPVADTSKSMEGYARVKLRHFLSGPGRFRFPAVDKPVISIVIPTYQQAHYTLIGLESLLSSGSKVPFEVIVVDNGSTDETHALLDRFENLRVIRNDRNRGFGEACNRGIDLARGEYVCFLNNDTIVTPGWLDLLLETARTQPRCGGVGAKLVHPSGLLQEAGGIIWRDGSNSGYGRDADPSDPEYDYLREVDYCSAACFLVKRSLLRDLGGFDPRYAPAYCEDTDLCMAIREAGYRIIYQPQACVFHIEFGSSKPGRAVELQLRNREKFRARWRHQLRRYPAAGPVEEWFARDRREGRRLLVADDRVPDPGYGSGFPRARSLLEALAALGYVVTFLPLSDPSPHEPATTELQQLGIEVLHGQTDLRGQLASRTDLYDALIVSRPHNAHWISKFQEFNPHAAVIYDAEAVFCLRDALRAEVEGDPWPKSAVTRKLREELSLADSADAVITVSESERALFARHHPDLRVFAWGASITARNNPPPFDLRSGYLFVGSLATPPNADALRVLLNSILPAIRRSSDAQLTVVGANPQPPSLAAASQLGSVLFTGYVDDLDPYFDRARVFLAPHRFAAGSPYKVIQAMASGIPCVLSTLLAAQMDVNDGDEALVADGVDEFREQAIRLHDDRDLWQRVQQNALRLIVDRYDPGRMREVLRECIEGCFVGSPGPGSGRCSCASNVIQALPDESILDPTDDLRNHSRVRF